MENQNVVQYDEAAISGRGNFAKDFFLNFSNYAQQEKYKDSKRVLFGKSFDMIRDRNALDNYILKYYSKLDDRNSEERKIKKNMEIYLSSVYRNFMDKPLEMMGSPFLSNLNTVYKYCPNKELVDKIKEKHNETLKDWKSLYVKDMQQDNLSKDETDKLMWVLIHNIGTDNKDMKEYQEAYLKKLISKDVKTSQLSFKQVEFIAKYVNNWMLAEANKNIETKVYIGEERESLGGVQRSSGIFINKNSGLTSSIPDLVQIVCHETQHAIQADEAIKNPNSQVGVDYAIMRVISDYYKSKSGFDVYHKNYRTEKIEKNAEEEGYRNASIFLRTLGFNEKGRKSLQEKRDKFSNRGFEYDFRNNGQRNSIREEFIFESLNNAVKSKPGVLNMYPALLLLYNKDGKPKSFEEFMTKKFQSNQDQCTIPHDFCKYYILNGALDKLNLNQFTEEEQANITSRLTDILTDEKFLICEMGKNSYNLSRIAQINKSQTEKRHLKITKEIMEYVNNNYEHLMNLQRKGKISSTSDMGEYVSDMQTLKNDNIYKGLQYDNNINEIKRLAWEGLTLKDKYYSNIVASKNKVTNSLDRNDLFKNTRMGSIIQMEKNIEKDRQISSEERKNIYGN